ncbi:aromatic ring-hydroxylating dioxygenase subunit alpha [Devosia sp. J2-20]|uniref:Aromatic ring-hydroxylating dioxygenase subunit alpha n=1 Tax=Devosia litorisediminis TaxID=2829817 RepID=A0A942I539_9HYPH|nr:MULTISPECIES: aromatic ring-hydroxylating dioxygenase subunit alpha [Devosia]MBS3847327.1 aromatic ring-hydroxylating dioxygenase subunit alpha [Devosia litorisediminis]WDQ99543.1 aromatic ring-hydroxylating dioxygenase subunit alpha [Devosia sp. J2-20]|tara:strand:+ start:1114 stop:2007 length:894 start_codon:yes stop_codon:yes gene_type:complete
MTDIDPTTHDLWQVIAATDEVPVGQVETTILLDTPIALTRDRDGLPVVWRRTSEQKGDEIDPETIIDRLPVITGYGYVWTSFGHPPAELFPIPEYAEADRTNMSCGSIGLHVSAPRAVENFLDMGHFPYVHTDILGAEPHTEVKEYDVEVSEERDEVLATRCKFFQPRAALSATDGMEVEYVYRVPHPFCSVLYKSSPEAPERRDVIAIFLQPMTQERCRAHLLQSMIDSTSTITELRRFQQTIFGQDKPILENQYPKRLPLDPRAETPIRADKSAIAYRRWLSQKGITYGTIPMAS